MHERHDSGRASERHAHRAGADGAGGVEAGAGPEPALDPGPLSEIEGQTLSRRWFIGAALSAAAAGGAAASRAGDTAAGAQDQPEGGEAGPGEDEGGPEVSEADVRAALRVAGLEFREDDIAMMVPGLRRARAQYRTRRDNATPGTPPARVFRVLGEPEAGNATEAGRGVRMPGGDGDAPMPGDFDDIAYAPAWVQGAWIRRGVITSERLTRIYLDRIDAHANTLNCVVTLLRAEALERARAMDAEIASGRIRGPLHGLPYGAKDLFDTAGVRTTYGAEPFRDRVPDATATAVERLEEAGAVLLAKTSLGALAYGDIWFGGKCRNPFNPRQGSSGSSAGSASGVSAGLFSFTIGTETLGSIVSPCMRCGSAGLRPTFGRVPRTNSMELCWSLDKVGPICRTIADAALVLEVLNGADAGDPSSVDAPFDCDLTRGIEGLRIGYEPGAFEGRDGEGTIDTRMLEAARSLGAEMVEIESPAPEWTSFLRVLLNVEAASAFEGLTLSGRDAELTWQEPRAWPNTFRSTWLVPAVEATQAERLRREAMTRFDDAMSSNALDAIIGPSYASGLLLLTNMTGTPCAVVRTAMRDRRAPHGGSVWGRAFGDGAVVRVAHAIERELGVWRARPVL